MKLLTATIVAAIAIPAFAAPKDTEKRLAAAADTMSEIMGTPEKSIPQDLLNKSECAVVVPGLKKGAFIIGGKYGRGFVVCRKADGVGWGAPGAVRVEGGSVGFQIGGAETDVVMLVMNKGGVNKLLTSKFTLGGDASVAAGPLGRESSAQTDAMMNAEILTWSRQRGVFAGISLTGATLREDGDTNKEMYGQPYTNKDIVSGNVQPPATAAQLISILNKYSSRK
ncbi:MAG: lipid-binding SYLF domain-containing protein [Acidobacteria bacterium]|nr:lipid-binding SYLF domain-containing protein [Acidobacteriota bacterium]